MGSMSLERRRTGWDVVVGVLSAIAGIVVLGHVALASVISVLFLGWMLLASGLVLAVGAIANWGDPSRRWNLAWGVVLGLLGLGFVRNPGVGLLTLTLLAGSLLFIAGVFRIVLAFQTDAARALLVISGAVTVVLSLMILLGWPYSALWFLGTIVGVELLIDGITIAATGRLRVAETAEGGGGVAMPPAAPAGG
jgi:uncharacterized membrane protein HdeD (DUF308 family)